MEIMTKITTKLIKKAFFVLIPSQRIRNIILNFFYRGGGGDRYIPFLVLWVGTRCTLRCNDCCNLIPYTEPVSFDTDLILADLRKIAQICTIKNLQIQGGEPLCHKNLDVVINEIGKIKQIKNVVLATNGTLLFNDKILNAINNNQKIEVRISDYNCTTEKRQSVIKQLTENKINFSLYEFVYGNKIWFNSGGPNEARNEVDNAVQKIYDSCTNKICWTLADGYLTVCGKIPVLKKLKTECITYRNDEVNVRETEDMKILKKEMDKFIFNHRFREHCRYCRGTEESEKVEAGLQISQNK
jgi:organic radical activating enzyme